MKVLDRSAFKKTINVYSIEIKPNQINNLNKCLKNYYFKNRRCKITEEKISDNVKLFLNPALIKNFDDFSENTKIELKNLGITKDMFSNEIITLDYDYWKLNEVLKAILPKDEPPLTSYSIIGHIVHLNLKDHLIDYKYIIAEVLKDKVSVAKTVVNKTNKIDNVYRNFEMEVLCGEPDFIASVIEYDTKFEFDFSKVYWNPRLSTEHNRIVNLVNHGDVLFDVFAGVGPFSIRAAKKNCLVHANDLNPDSFKWLNHNINLNKKAKGWITTYNKDGSDFILNDFKSNMLKIWSDSNFLGQIHVVMNLPAKALSFLKYFKGLFDEQDLKEIKKDHLEKHLPIIYCYFFAKKDESLDEIFKTHLEYKFDENEYEFNFVRNVSNGKNMHRVTFQMPLSILMIDNSDISEPLPKRISKSLKAKTKAKEYTGNLKKIKETLNKNISKIDSDFLKLQNDISKKKEKPDDK
ncbi:conserved hypothetical protein [Pediculus humanus corporis]|uniref:tRNA (guanine(37)-N(1))-methyltransferase n=1 Tax=Pediculus humanus subsp. corporis TaxID=121224 RepID=TRM5_PEDHC|nr:uncharacterized protein Phum_PHUM294360 [Pediculus humanus corporis]E0VLV0.1 RecName: Full=tRNA (guanine(37)-N1)-methyltransferase; AltName: Full=M1G-methyltransferase; AltName: Full=tRNA [GM37] methyltransferase; AltName: Full=tRNA methyltransferase 5 homolog [Pediculus humanus corporis]EEB14356.1 conserved hypothetical protein [Pediculus humanus corporis]